MLHTDLSTYYEDNKRNETSNYTLSTNQPITLAPPLLNITILWGVSPSPLEPLQGIDVAWIYSNESYNIDYIHSHGSCQALAVRIHDVGES
jgi:hypothetical protein